MAEFAILTPRWRRSSRCADSCDCVEVARIGDVVGVRDSTDPDGPVLTFTPTAWRAFIAAVARGEFDYSRQT